MPGKGQRRREKNYRAAHGGDSRLPPPPDPRAADAVPSKLRRLMQLMKSPHPGQVGAGTSEGSKDGRGRQDKRTNRGDPIEEKSMSNVKEDPDEMANMGSHDKNKRKRTKKGPRDLRFQDLEQAGGQRKQKRKEYLKARKIKKKRTRSNEGSEFPDNEQVKFGEVVDAPPKLSFPKGLKAALDASAERRRLQAVEAYRSHKGWESRPGIHLPLISEGHSQ